MPFDSSNWTPVTLGEVAQEITTHEKDPESQGLERYVGLEHMDPGDPRIRRWGLISEGVTFTKVFRAGQVLFGKRRVYQKKTGVPDFDGLCSGDIIVLDTKDQRITREFLALVVQTDAFFAHAEKTSSGSLSPRTKYRELAQFEFLLPPPEQQRELVELMQAFDEALEAGQTTEDAIKYLQTSRSKELFDEVSQRTIQSLATINGIQTGPFGSQLKANEYTSTGTPLVMPKDIQDGKIITDSIARVPNHVVARLQVHILEKGDIVFARRGDLSKIALIDDRSQGFLCGTGCLRFRPKDHVESKLLLRYLLYNKTIEWLKDHAVGTTMPNLNASIISQIPIPSILTSEGQTTLVIQEIESIDMALQFSKSNTQQLYELRQSFLNEAIASRVTKVTS